ncbi:hypothetical protein N9L24_03815, partial [Candidatus Marinamargulisbacteria bacterium]|nr:hypothetical protein [Candidatus Marinamargulisbacteria bacterium]
IKDNIQMIRKPIDNDDSCLISLTKYNKLEYPVEFRGKVYELSNLVDWIYVTCKDSLAQGRQIEFKVPHSNEVKSYSSLSKLFEDIKFVNFTQPGA